MLDSTRNDWGHLRADAPDAPVRHDAPQIAGPTSGFHPLHGTPTPGSASDNGTASKGETWEATEKPRGSLAEALPSRGCFPGPLSLDLAIGRRGALEASLRSLRSRLVHQGVPFGLIFRSPPAEAVGFPRGGSPSDLLPVRTEARLQKHPSVSGRPLQWAEGSPSRCGRYLSLCPGDFSLVRRVVSDRSCRDRSPSRYRVDLAAFSAASRSDRSRPAGLSRTSTEIRRLRRHSRRTGVRRLPVRGRSPFEASREPKPLRGWQTALRRFATLRLDRSPPVEFPFPEPKHRSRESKGTTSLPTASTQIHG